MPARVLKMFALCKVAKFGTEHILIRHGKPMHNQHGANAPHSFARATMQSALPEERAAQNHVGAFGRATLSGIVAGAAQPY
jgi:hypothetical protein